MLRVLQERENPKNLMKSRNLLMMASLFANIVCLSFPLFGGAQPIEFSLKADFSFSPQPPPFPGSHLSIQFQVPPFSSANFYVESTNAFFFHDVQSVFGIDTTTSTNDIAVVPPRKQRQE